MQKYLKNVPIHTNLSKSLEHPNIGGMHFIAKSNGLIYCRAKQTVIQQKASKGTSIDLFFSGFKK